MTVGRAAEHAPRPVLTATIAVRGLAAAETLPRICGLLAQRALVPRQLVGRRDGKHLYVDLQLEVETLEMIERLIAKLDAMTLVERAWLVASRAIDALPEHAEGS